MDKKPHQQPPSGNEQLTASQCREFADGTKNLPTFAQLTPEDAEVMEEEQFGKPINHGSAVEGIAAMQRRIAILKGHKAKVINVLEDCEEQHREVMEKDLAELNKQIDTAEQRLADYEAQLKGQN